MEPMLSLGDYAVFCTLTKPEPGSCVLISTDFGPEIRQFEPLSDGQWAGCALNPEYEPVLSSEERCWVIAVLVGVLPGTEVSHGQ
ncbi:MAG: S24 family peptidase [Burkholderiaceae bacterium]|nr:S24 family peptidase [Burkholderiaceae bacterium]